MVQRTEIMPRGNKFQFGTARAEAPRAVSTGVVLVWVQCKEHRCLAYQDAAGRWTNFYTGKVLTDFVEVIG